MDEKNELEIKAHKDSDGNIKLSQTLAHTFDDNNSVTLETDTDKNISITFKTKF